MSDGVRSDGQLQLLVERIERIGEEIAGLQDDRKDIYAEAKVAGYDPAVIRAVIARRRMPPDQRAEADALIETYEAALAGAAPDPAVPPDAAARELAVAVLAEQFSGMDDPVQADLLVEHVAVLLDIRAEIADLRRQEQARRKLAVAEGFLAKPMMALVQWLEKCAKHGVDAMRGGEAVFHLYRGTVEGREGGPAPSISGDPKLQAAFGAGGKGAAGKALANTLAWLETGMGN